MDQTIKQKMNKFTQDPDWVFVQQHLESCLAPLYDTTNINTSKSNDEIAAEVRGRQISIETITKFLQDMGFVKSKINSKPTKFI